MNNKRIIFYVIFFILAISIVRIIFVVEKFHGRGTGWGRRRDNFWRLGAPIYGYGYPYPIISLIQVSVLSRPIAIVEIQYAIVPVVLEISKIEKFSWF